MVLHCKRGSKLVPSCLYRRLGWGEPGDRSGSCGKPRVCSDGGWRRQTAQTHRAGPDVRGSRWETTPEKVRWSKLEMKLACVNITFCFSQSTIVLFQLQSLAVSSTSGGSVGHCCTESPISDRYKFTVKLIRKGCQVQCFGTQPFFFLLLINKITIKM